MTPTDAGYLGSMGGTLYAAMGMHSYILTIVCCGAQVCVSYMHLHLTRLNKALPLGCVLINNA